MNPKQTARGILFTLADCGLSDRQQRAVMRHGKRQAHLIKPIKSLFKNKKW